MIDVVKEGRATILGIAARARNGVKMDSRTTHRV